MTSTWASPVLPVTSAGQRGDVERERAAARAQGYAAGWTHGAQAARAAVMQGAERHRLAGEAEAAAELDRLRQAVRALTAAAERLENATVPVAAEAADAVLDVALRLAAAVLGHEPMASAAPGRDALRRAMAAPAGTGGLRVRLHPADAETLSTDDLDGVAPGVTVVPDSSLDPGDAVVEHDGGHLDLRLRAALDRAAAVLLP